MGWLDFIANVIDSLAWPAADNCFSDAPSQGEPPGPRKRTL
jgi:hypothetical protein